MILLVAQKDEKANQKKKDSESDNNVRFSFTFPLRKLRGTKKIKSTFVAKQSEKDETWNLKTTQSNIIFLIKLQVPFAFTCIKRSIKELMEAAKQIINLKMYPLKF